MTVQTIVGLIVDELYRAEASHPHWPADPVHAAAIVAEECGELQKAVIESMYEPHKSEPADARAEAIQTAAMCIRFLMHMDGYNWEKPTND